MNWGGWRDLKTSLLGGRLKEVEVGGRREAWDVVRGSWGRPGRLATGDSFRLLEDRAPRATTRSERARAQARCGEKEGSEERGVFERGDVQEKKQ